MYSSLTARHVQDADDFVPDAPGGPGQRWSKSTHRSSTSTPQARKPSNRRAGTSEGATRHYKETTAQQEAAARLAFARTEARARAASAREEASQKVAAGVKEALRSIRKASADAQRVVDRAMHDIDSTSRAAEGKMVRRH